MLIKDAAAPGSALAGHAQEGQRQRQAEQDRRQQIIAERAKAEQIRIEKARRSAAIDRVQFAQELSPWGESDAPQMSENREETEEPTL